MDERPGHGKTRIQSSVTTEPRELGTMTYQITRRRFTAALGGAVLAGAWARPGFADAK
jgi:hypothetical protein